MSEAIAINVRFARQAQHTALWARHMAAKFPEARSLYLPMARRNKRNARHFMARARRLAS